MLQVIFEKVDNTAILPTKGSAEAACWDVYAAESCYTVLGEVTKVSTKLRVKIPKGYMLHIVPRSGLAVKHGIQTMAGIVDSDYRGELIIVLTRIYPKRHFINHGDRIAQIQLHPIPEWECVEGKVLSDTERGAGGFGSTDKPKELADRNVDRMLAVFDCSACGSQVLYGRACWNCQLNSQ